MTNESLARCIAEQRPVPRSGFDQHIAQQLDILVSPLLRKRVHPLRRALIIAACLVLAGTTALSAATPFAAYELLERIWPEVVQALRPVNTVYESEGIRLEIVSAAAKGGTANVYFTLQDLTGNRLDDTTDLTRSKLLHLSEEGTQTCRILSFDSDTNTLHFLSQLTTTYGEPIGGEKMRFTLKNIASQRKTVQVTLLGKEELAALPRKVEARPSVRYHIISCRGNAIGNVGYGIIPTQEAIAMPAERVSLINAGYANGELHVQLRLQDAWINADNGSLYLVNGEKRLRQTASLGWRDGNDMLYEFIFAITPEEAAACTLEGEFVQAEVCVRGEWEVFFPLANEP